MNTMVTNIMMTTLQTMNYPEIHISITHGNNEAISCNLKTSAVYDPSCVI